MKTCQALQFGYEKLKKAKIKSARLDAEILLIEAKKREGRHEITRNQRAWFYAHPEYELNKNQIAKYKKYISQRAKHEPVAYIIGHKEFYELDFMLNKNVLIPRPESEMVVELALKQLTTNNQQLTKVIDVGTGSGCIIISLIKNLPFTIYPSFAKATAGKQLPITFYAIDNSSQALAVAKKNAQLHGIGNKIKFIKSDLLENIPNSIFPALPAGRQIPNLSQARLRDSEFIFVANLPYLTLAQYKNNPDIKYEPKKALVGGKDGLKYYKQLLQQIKSRVMGCRLQVTALLEIDPSQKSAMQKIVKQFFPKAKIKFIKDLAGKNRVMLLEL